MQGLQPGPMSGIKEHQTTLRIESVFRESVESESVSFEQMLMGLLQAALPHQAFCCREPISAFYCHALCTAHSYAMSCRFCGSRNSDAGISKVSLLKCRYIL